PVILYCGPSGVGKSSVLDAGLKPYLDAGSKHEVVYIRRDADLGLLGSLVRGLEPGCVSTDPADDLPRLWLDRERTGRALIIVLDQAEEVFTRPRRQSPREEITDLVGAVRDVFADSTQAPRGRLILGFRKEWLHEFERAHDEARLGYERMLLEPLDRT